MRIIELKAENFKKLHAVEIKPTSDMVIVGGKNGSGKSSVLDAIYVALVGRSVAPPRPIRTGEEECTIHLDLGDIKVTRKFTAKDGGAMTDSLKVESAEGLRYSKPQQVLDALLGEIGFDPFEFVQMKPAEQADTLLHMVPLPVDLDELAELDASDFAKRRDINRDAASLKAQVEAIPKEDVPADLPDRQTLVDQLGNAAETNTAIERDRVARDVTQRNIDALGESSRQKEGRAAELRAQAEALDAEATEDAKRSSELSLELQALPPVPEPVDTDAIRTQLREAEAVLQAAERQKRRAELDAQHTAKAAESAALTAAMEAREKERQDALAKAKMPIEGLAFAIDEKGKPLVQFGGVPFEQASTAEQLRASTAIAMAANPSLRVLRIKDGSLLDDESMALLSDMAKGEDFQLFIERVGTGGVGIIMEDGSIAGGTLAESKPKATPKKGAGEPAEALL